MPLKRRRQSKNKFCESCRKWFTAKRIGKHVLFCTKWDAEAIQSDGELSHLSNGTHNDQIINEISLSSDGTASDHGTDHGVALGNVPSLEIWDDHISLADDGGMDDVMEVDEGLEEAFNYQQERVYDEQEDDDWWNEFCVPEPEDSMEEEEGAEEFEEILNWIDNEFNLEVAQNRKWTLFCAFSYLNLP